MDSEDTSRILNQMWEADPEKFMDWIIKNQPKLLEHLGTKEQKP